MADHSLSQNEQEIFIQNLKKKNQYLETVVSLMTEGIVAVDCQGIIQFMNKAALELTGFTVQEAYDQPYESILYFVNQLTSEKIELPLADVCKTEKRKSLFEHIDLIDCLGSARHVHVELIPAKENNLNVLISFKDITGINQMREEVSRMQRLDALSKLAGGIAHDFNNMLTGIMGMSELISMELEGREDSELLTYSKNIIEVCERASHVTEDLLSFSRQRQKGYSPIDLNEQIQMGIRDFESTQIKGVKVVTQFTADRAAMFADPVQIRNIVTNLLQNASEAIKGEGVITIKTENRYYNQDDFQRNSQLLEQGEYYVFTVLDRGTGIDPDALTHIFEPFYTTKEVGKGNGLGLSTVYGSVISHGGTVSVHSEPGKGSLFEVALPLNKSEKSTDQLEISF
jgi:two-component system cell cycle sensor histidine kinase/response regulator CckA